MMAVEWQVGHSRRLQNTRQTLQIIPGTQNKNQSNTSTARLPCAA
jgi:hypothetical protein